ncbi:MAG TPA: hypothetical protein VF815_21895 [Myxococcaceae bacterium]|jgi:hypothetical protein
MDVTWQQALKNPDFWWWYWMAEGWEAHQKIAKPQEALRFGHPGQGLGLVLEVSEYERTLYLEHPRLSEPAQLGWLDDAHWHPDVLRWEETVRAAERLIGGASAPLRRSEALLLLAVFTPVTRTDDREQVTRLLDAAAVEVGVPALVHDLIHFHASNASDAEWRCDDGRWVILGEVYSLRDPRNRSFPFLELQELSSS